MISGSCTTAKWQGSGTIYEHLESYKKELVIDALQKSEGNIFKASRLLGVHRSSVELWVEQLGLLGFVQRRRACKELAMRKNLMGALLKTKGRIRAAAREINVNERTVRYWIGRLRLRPLVNEQRAKRAA